ncbi:MAG TPA: hypothetical protein VFW05_06090 [Verrucomicrobiae bacterium]|nr:hypothetical protein [Verrucomicrobiae bacterium]
MALPKVYDWRRVRAALELLAESFPAEFSNWVLIGGGACWFYRESLDKANDPDFRVPPVSAEDEIHWLSKDVDFMGLMEAEATELLQAPFNAESHTISFKGLEVDFLEEGFRLAPELAQAARREVRTSDFIFYVVDPAVLYSEKCALITKKDRPQDRLHQMLLREYLKYEFRADVENLHALEPSNWIASVRTVKTADLTFFEQDERLQHRLIPAMAALTAPEFRAIKHWAKHHLPGYSE